MIVRFAMPGLAGILYFASLAAPAYRAQDGESYPGFYCAFFGVFALSMGVVPFVAWLSNAPFALAVMRCLFASRSHFLDAITAWAAVLMASGAFRVTELMRDEAGNLDQVSPAWGIWLWMAALILVALAISIRLFAKKTD